MHLPRPFSRESLLFASVAVVLFSGCTFLPSRNPAANAFISYWPPPEKSTQLRLAVKDNIDMRGEVTTAGSVFLAKNSKPAKRDAACLTIARQRGVQIVGKTNLSEFAIAPSGVNDYYGTPRNPLSAWRKRVPGGSSCGAAVAITSGLADVAFGTDTAGSVRVPAACCGIVGLKTTQGLVPLDGVFPVDRQRLDTVGPLAIDIAHTVQGMELLQSGFASKYAAARIAKPSGKDIRVGRLYLKGTDPKIDQAVDAAIAEAGFQVVRLDDAFRAKWKQAHDDGTTLAAVGAWKSDQKYLGKLGVSARTKAIILYGGAISAAKYRQALARQGEWQQTLARVFKKVDFVALPTLQSVPPPVPTVLKIDVLEAIPAVLKLDVLEALMLTVQNTVPANFAGNPALAVPIPLAHAIVPFASLQLVGPRLSEAELLNAGRMVGGEEQP
jgi:Asp-tRNA(Asn)/Glu-tRNA(Gln) amidotransferase A subunit family amidase